MRDVSRTNSHRESHSLLRLGSFLQVLSLWQLDPSAKQLSGKALAKNVESFAGRRFTHAGHLPNVVECVPSPQNLKTDK